VYVIYSDLNSEKISSFITSTVSFI